MKRPGDIASLTGLRGAAAMFVVLYHYTFEGGLGPPLARRVIGHGYFSVDLFLVLSGFVMALVHAAEFRDRAFWPSFRSFMARRIGRIYPLYLVMTLVCAIVAYCGFNDLWPPAGQSAGWLIRNILLIQSLGGGQSIDLPGWSISTEMAAYVLFPALCFLCLWRATWQAAVVGALCLLVYAGLTLVPSAWLPAGTRGARMAWLDMADCRTLYPLLRCLAGFTLGLLTWRAYAGAPGRWLRGRRWPSDVLACTIGALLCLRNVDALTVSLFPPLILCLAVDRSMLGRILSLRPFAWLGIISYSIYLVHTPVRDVIEALVPAPSGSRMLLTIAELLVTMAAATLTYALVEAPGRRFAMRLTARLGASRFLVRNEVLPR